MLLLFTLPPTMPPRTRNASSNEPPALEDPALMPVAALQTELQRLGYKFRKDSVGNRLKTADLVTLLKAARTLGVPVAPSVAVAPVRKRARR